MLNMEALVGSTQRSVRLFDSQDKTTAIRSGHPTQDHLVARSRGRGTRRGRGGNRVTHHETSPVARGQASHPKEEEGTVTTQTSAKTDLASDPPALRLDASASYSASHVSCAS